MYLLIYDPKYDRGYGLSTYLFRDDVYEYDLNWLLSLPMLCNDPYFSECYYFVHLQLQFKEHFIFFSLLFYTWLVLAFVTYT